MGIDLKLLVVDFENEAEAVSGSLLALDRDSNLFDKIQDLPHHSFSKPLFTHLAEIPKDVSFPGIPLFRKYFGLTVTNGLGDTLKFVQAKDLAHAVADLKKDEFWETFSLRNKAALHYISALDPETKIALWWS